ncbi:MAG TPA: hypothetical protein VK772_01175 [Puia sp.]|jgi:hypothetical protein|nr:hypothetical protein [Puia sp.]
MRLLILIILLHLDQPSPEFQLNIQHGGAEFDKSEDKGAIDYSGLIKILDHYPWLDEIDKANTTQKSSPTIMVRYPKGVKELWVSMSGDRSNYGYLVGYNHNKRVNGKTVKWVEIYLPDDTKKVQQLFGLFFEKEFDALEKELSHLEKFK